jgi:hypothetical protein
VRNVRSPEVVPAPTVASNLADVEAYGVGRPCCRCRAQSFPESEMYGDRAGGILHVLRIYHGVREPI